METIDTEQLLAIGAIGLVFIGIALLVVFLVMAGTLKFTIKWLGNSDPSFLSCLGLLAGITFINGFIGFAAFHQFGPSGSLIATPLTWLVTAYMVSSTAECGLFRGIWIWFVNSFLGTFALIVIMLGVLIPLGALGAGMQEFQEMGDAAGQAALENQFAEADRAIAEAEAQLDAIEIPELNQVSQGGNETSDSVDEANGTSSKKDQVSSLFFDDGASEVKPPPQKRRPVPRKAPDGSTVNPFFQN